MRYGNNHFKKMPAAPTGPEAASACLLNYGSVNYY